MAVDCDMHLINSLMSKVLPTNVANIYVSIMGWHRQLFLLLGIHFHAFVCISSFTAPFIEETTLSTLCGFGSLVKDRLIIHV